MASRAEVSVIPRASPGGPVPLIHSREIKNIKLLTSRDHNLRLDVGPFYLTYCYAVSQIFLFWFQGRWSDVGTQLYPMIGGVVLLHILLKLFMHWSVDVKAAAAFTKARGIAKATHVKVEPTEFSGSKEIVPLTRRQLGDGSTELAFEYRKQRFVYDTVTDQFHKLQYPTKETFDHYYRSSGYTKEQQVATALQIYGKNVFEVPAPQFLALLKEQMLAPFFVFQVFCVGLWCLDEFWYYSLFTLGMLVMFESTVVNQRLRSLKELRSLQTPKQSCMVYRYGKWEKLSGDELLPGDIISIGRPSGAGADDQVAPADALLLAGTCIINEAILTGESTPQWKSGVGHTAGQGEGDHNGDVDCSHRLHIKQHKAHVLFGGTKILQHSGDKTARIRTPDGGCLAVVLRTGFETAQGRLMRTILFSTERVTANNWETGLFILFLLVFAVSAAVYVLREGLKDKERSRFKLFLNCTMIITSVIPPELPMELSIAVNTSLLALARKSVFCTEPFRIPMAGKVTVCCFDKTGTLTSDNMLMQGVALCSDKGRQLLTNLREAALEVQRVLAGCHSLVNVDGSLVGDPLERASLQATGWSYGNERMTSPTLPDVGKEKLTILHRHLFSSSLKRMSAIVQVENDKGSGCWVVLKGAPEIIQPFLNPVPEEYEATHKYWSAQGARVIGLAYKALPEHLAPSALRSMPREEVEKDLTFAGFGVFQTPLKSDSEPALKMLLESNHQLVMITGDAALTACHTAAAVHIVTRMPLMLMHKGHSQKSSNLSHHLPDVVEPDRHYEWLSPDESVRIPFTSVWNDVLEVASEYDLCITGDGLSHIQQIGAASTFIPLTQVFARVSPEQKELILRTLRACGLTTLMCGDGTNDVGALKAAHCGIALLAPAKEKNVPIVVESIKNGPIVERESSAAPALPSKTQRGTKEAAGSRKSSRDGRFPPSSSSSAGSVVPTAGSNAAASSAPKKKRGAGQKLIDDMRAQGRPVDARVLKMAEWMDKMEEQEAPMVKPGDASMAAPFTAKQSSVMPCTDIIKQGRCTLVTTVQMFKILGLLCLSTAYGLSVMYLDGVKLGDIQATLQGFLTAGLFFFISNAKPLPSLSPERPHPNVFCTYLMMSLLGQFACHLTFLITIYKHSLEIMPPDLRQTPDSDFKPNLVNTVCFLINFIVQIITFAVNYVGHPFNSSIVENKGMNMCLRYAACLYLLLVLDPIGLGELMSLVPIPNQLQMELVLGAMLCFVVTYVWETGLRKAFPAKLPPLKGYMMFKKGKQPKKLKAA